MRGVLCLSLVLAACVPVAIVGGCGAGDEAVESGSTAEEVRLTAVERQVVRRAQREVGQYCAARAAALAPGGRALADVDARPVNDALAELAELARAKPAAATPGGGSVRLALGDIAENLEGTNCDPRLVAGIQSLLRELPPD